MSDSPLLSKMDALLKKHRGGSEDVRDTSPAPSPSTEHAAPPNAWLPVLTQVIERGTPPSCRWPTLPRQPRPPPPLPPPSSPKRPLPSLRSPR